AEASDIAVDDAGNVYVTGSFQGQIDCDPGPATYNLTSAGSLDTFIVKLDPGGNLLWSRAMGGTALDAGYGISLDAAGDVYTVGRFFGTADFDPGPDTHNLTSAGDSDAFVSKLDSAGNFIWAEDLGGSAQDEGRKVGVDAAGNIYVAGLFYGTADF